LLFFLLPIVLWLGSLFCATQVFVPKMHLDVNLNDVSVAAWQQIKQKYEAIVEKKLGWLHRSQLLLVVSFGVVLLVLVVLALLPAPTASGPTPIIIVTPTVGPRP
jgi:hypothetical protein